MLHVKKNQIKPAEIKTNISKGQHLGHNGILYLL